MAVPVGLGGKTSRYNSKRKMMKEERKKGFQVGGVSVQREKMGEAGSMQ
jgi:hypothetical protein